MIDLGETLVVNVNVNDKLNLVEFSNKGGVDVKDITELAKDYDVTTRTIRYYEELGLLRPERTAGNKRVFPRSEIVKMKLIARGKRYGFTLAEIKEMILLFDKDRTGEQQLKRTIQFGEEKIAEINKRITELQEMKTEMEEIMNEFTERLEEL